MPGPGPHLPGADPVQRRRRLLLLRRLRLRRLHARRCPAEIVEAARIDGASSLRDLVDDHHAAGPAGHRHRRRSSCRCGSGTTSSTRCSSSARCRARPSPPASTTVASNQFQPDYGQHVRLHVPRRAHPGRRLPRSSRSSSVAGLTAGSTQVTPQPQYEGRPAPTSTGACRGVPDLDQVAGHWIDAADLAHLPSLRNQCGQGHVNADLSSLSWLAAPPYTVRLPHRGAAARREDPAGAAVPLEALGRAARARRPAGDRAHRHPDGAASATLCCGRSRSPTPPASRSTARISQDLYAMVAQTDTGWGWLYDVPWTAGNYHDFMTLERIRSTVAGRAARPRYLLGPGPRRLRLGKPRLPGIQRDARHRADVARLRAAPPRQPGHRLPARATAPPRTVRGLSACGDAGAGAADPASPGRDRARPVGEVTLGSVRAAARPAHRAGIAA